MSGDNNCRLLIEKLRNFEVKNENDVHLLKQILRELNEYADYNLRQEIKSIFNAIISARKKHLNLDDGDVAYLEFIHEFGPINEALKTFRMKFID